MSTRWARITSVTNSVSDMRPCPTRARQVTARSTCCSHLAAGSIARRREEYTKAKHERWQVSNGGQHTWHAMQGAVARNTLSCPSLHAAPGARLSPLAKRFRAVVCPRASFGSAAHDPCRRSVPSAPLSLNTAAPGPLPRTGWRSPLLCPGNSANRLQLKLIRG